MIKLPSTISGFMYKRVAEDAASSVASEPLLEDAEDEKMLLSFKRQRPVWPWMVSTFLLSLAFLVVLILDYPFYPRRSFETGFATEMRMFVLSLPSMSS